MDTSYPSRLPPPRGSMAQARLRCRTNDCTVPREMILPVPTDPLTGAARRLPELRGRLAVDLLQRPDRPQDFGVASGRKSHISRWSGIFRSGARSTTAVLSQKSSRRGMSASGDRSATGVLPQFSRVSGIPFNGDRSRTCVPATFGAVSGIPRRGRRSATCVRGTTSRVSGSPRSGPRSASFPFAPGNLCRRATATL